MRNNETDAKSGFLVLRIQLCNSRETQKNKQCIKVKTHKIFVRGFNNPFRLLLVHGATPRDKIH
uniref:Uncharacterized protein n=1 Tax=Cannabis sativa TaxID=3483 RepID=A0A803RA74_CANSA